MSDGFKFDTELALNKPLGRRHPQTRKASTRCNTRILLTPVDPLCVAEWSSLFADTV